MSDTYTVEYREHGVLVFAPGGLPISDFMAVGDLASAKGFDLVDPGIAHACDATLAYVNTESGAAWRAQINAGLDLVAATDHLADATDGNRVCLNCGEALGRPHRDGCTPLYRWSRGPDTGLSSLTIAHVLSGGKVPIPTGMSSKGSIPVDPDDFGRCLGLLEVMPEWRERLDEVVAFNSQWAGLVEHWPELERLAAEGPWRRLYDRLHDCILGADGA